MRPGLFKYRRETSDEIGAVIVVPENRRALNAPGDDMAEGVRGVDAGLSGHEE
jgi:hypothetical protein